MRYDTGRVTGEPTLGITDKGVLFFLTWEIDQRFPPAPGVIRSTDGGRSWKDVSPGPGAGEEHAHALDPHLYLDRETGRLVVASFLLPCHQVSVSDDLGENWSTVVGNCNVMDREIVFGGPPTEEGREPDGYPNVLYFCTAEIGYLNNTCNRSFDGGASWEPGGITFETSAPEAVTYSSIASSNGNVNEDGIVYVTKADYYGQPHVAISRDEGLTYERVQVSNLGSQWHDAGIGGDPAGNLYYAWIANDRLPYLTISRDAGKTWGKPMMVGPPGIKEASQPEIAVGATGRVAVTYMGSRNSPYQRCEASCDTTAYERTTWNGYTTVTSDALSPDPVFYTGSTNTPAEPLVRGTCRQQRCQGTLDFHDIQIGPDGTVWTALVDTCFGGGCEHTGPSGTAYGKGVIGRLLGLPLLDPAR